MFLDGDADYVLGPTNQEPDIQTLSAILSLLPPISQEDPLDAVRREVREETHLVVEPQVSHQHNPHYEPQEGRLHLESHSSLRPTLWIEPIGDWSEGDMRLLEIPVTTENNANILAQWRPRVGVAAA